MRRVLVAVTALALPCAALAQTIAPPSAPPAADSPDLARSAWPLTAPKNTPVIVALGQPLGSNTSKAGDRFAITLAEPLVIDGRLTLPAGTPGVGEVVHAAPSGFGGRSGELLLAARYLEIGETRIPLKAFQFAAVGRDTGPGSLFAMGLVKGGQVIVPAGARGTAKIAADVALPAPAETPPPARPRNPDRFRFHQQGRPMKLQFSALLLAAALACGPALAQDAPAPTAPAEAAAAAPDVVPGLIKAPPAGKGQVVFFRKNSIFGAAISYKVRTGPNLESVMGTMTNGVYFVVIADPGTHIFSGATEAKDAITVEVEEGETTFVEGALAVGVVAGRPDLKPSDQAAFEKAVKGGTKKAKKAK